MRYLAALIVLVATASAQNPRVIVGFEQSGAVSAAPAQRVFVDIYADEVLSAKVRGWTDLRLTTLPRETGTIILTLPVDVTRALTTTLLSDLVRSGEFRVGADLRLLQGGPNRAALSLIASFGADVPLGGDAFERQYGAGVRVTDASSRLDIEAAQRGALRFDVVRALPVKGLGFIYLSGTAQLKRHEDFYRLGLGLDFLQLLKALRNN